MDVSRELRATVEIHWLLGTPDGFLSLKTISCLGPSVVQGSWNNELFLKSSPGHHPKALLKNQYATARNKYRPTEVNVLLVAESPPSSGGYFYAEKAIGKDHLFRETMKALGLWPVDRPMRKGCDKRPMLEQFRSLGFFLIDACELPVDKMPPGQRRVSTAEGALTLPSKVKELDPGRIVIVKKTVFNPVRQALVMAGFEDRILNKKSLPFPSHGNQRKFRRMLKRLVGQNRPLILE